MALASRGLRDMNGRVERVEDAREREQLRAKGRRIRLTAALAAIAATLASLALP